MLHIMMNKDNMKESGAFRTGKASTKKIEQSWRERVNTV